MQNPPTLTTFTPWDSMNARIAWLTESRYGVRSEMVRIPRCANPARAEVIGVTTGMPGRSAARISLATPSYPIATVPDVQL